MEAQDNRIYAQIQHNKVHWLFTKAELPEWNNDMIPAVDITDLDPRPEIGWGYDGTTFAAPVVEYPTADELCKQVDDKADSARLKIAGDPLRVVEYQRAEAEAKAFAAAGYTGTVPPTVESWAEAKDWTAQVAADDILRASAAWNAALYAFRDIRLKGKEAVKAAIDPAAAQTAADAAITQIAAVLAQVVHTYRLKKIT